MAGISYRCDLLRILALPYTTQTADGSSQHLSRKSLHLRLRNRPIGLAVLVEGKRNDLHKRILARASLGPVHDLANAATQRHCSQSSHRNFVC